MNIPYVLIKEIVYLNTYKLERMYQPPHEHSIRSDKRNCISQYLQIRKNVPASYMNIPYIQIKEIVYLNTYKLERIYLPPT